MFDARPADKDVSLDPRTLALSLGSVQLLERIRRVAREAAQPIREVHVSQAPPTGAGRRGHDPRRRRGRADAGRGAELRRAGRAAAAQLPASAARSEPARLSLRLGTPVAALKDGRDEVEVDAGIAERFDLAVVAEGGVFADQSRKAVSHDYRQTAWVGQVSLDGGAADLAVERFTSQRPAGLAAAAGARRRHCAAGDAPRGVGVVCAASTTIRCAPLDDAQRIALLNALLPADAGRVVQLSALKRFALGLNAETTLVRGRTVRIGNAAQTLHPVAGQGLNLGLRDAFALVERAARSRRDIDAALRRIEWARAPDRWAMIATTDFLARSFTWRWPGLALAARRRAGVARCRCAGEVAAGAADDVRAALTVPDPAACRRDVRRS